MDTNSGRVGDQKEINGTRFKQMLPAWRVSFWADFPVHRLERKLENQTLAEPSAYCRSFIVREIRRVENRDTVCVEVDGPNHLFLCGRTLVPTHNSMLRNAFVPWYRKRRIEESEAIGVERDLAGMPMFYVPPEMFDENADDATKANLNAYRRIVETIKNDEQAGLVLPASFDPQTGNRTVEFSLVGTGSRRLFDTVAIADKYDKQIARVVLADFIFLGAGKAGSLALSSDKTEMFATALGAWLKEIATVLNRHAVPRLYELNGWNPSECAEFVPGDIEKAEIEKFANAVTALTGAGWLTPGSVDDEASVRNRLDLPEPPDDLEQRQLAAAAMAMPQPPQKPPDGGSSADPTSRAPSVGRGNPKAPEKP